MQKTLKRSLALLLAVLLLGGAAPLTVFVGAADTTYKQGDIIEFGSYPQTEVKDEALIAALNAEPKTWISYGYYSGTGRIDGQMIAGDFMKYCDVTYGEQKYRGVYFTQYRPEQTWRKPELDYTNQYDNGYYTYKEYWFRWEPLVWRSLDLNTKSNTGLFLSESLIDSQPFNSYAYFGDGGIHDEYDRIPYWGDTHQTFYANNYACSSIRSWLTDEADASSFLNTSFSAAQREGILPTTLDNSAFNALYSAYGCESTTDKVFLLSWEDALNPAYGFRNDGDDDPARLAVLTDYAKCQGGYVSPNTVCSTWRLRSAGITTYEECYCSGFGNLGISASATGALGIRPAIRLDLEKLSVTVTTNVTTESGSTVTGAGMYSIGDTVTLSAVPNGNEVFDGWYVDDICVSSETMYTFTAEKDVTVRAVFVHPVIGSVTLADCTVQAKSTAQLKPTVQSNGVNYTLTFASSNPNIATVDANGNVTALKKGSTTVTVTATDEYGNVEKATCTVTVKYAWWQVLIRIFLLGFIWY